MRGFILLYNLIINGELIFIKINHFRVFIFSGKKARAQKLLQVRCDTIQMR